MTSYIPEKEVIAASSAAKKRDRSQRQKIANTTNYGDSKGKINAKKGKTMNGRFTGTIDPDAERMTFSRLISDEAQARREAFIRECDETTATLGPDSTIRLSQIEAVAEEIVAASSVDHGQAVRMALDEAGATGPRGPVVTPNEYGSSYPHREEDEIIEMAVPTDAEVSHHALSHGTDYGDALRSMLDDSRDRAVAGSQPAGLGEVFGYTDEEMTEALRERGYDVD